MKQPVYEALRKLVDENSVSFHFPGHAGKITNIDWNLMPMMDTTETYGMDNLLEPNGIIKQSQELAAKIMGTKHTLYGVNGSTGSNYIAMSACLDRGSKVLIQRNSHKSIYNSLILNDLKPKYLYPNYNNKNKLLSGINVEDVKMHLQKDPQIEAVIITSPNYYGVVSDIEAIADIVHSYGKILIVDEAHGSHLVFSKKLPKSAIKCGADIVIHSTHKTITGLTQTSMLHVCSDRIDMDRLKDRYQLYTTTSPSYLFTLSNEMAVAYMDEIGGNRLDNNYEFMEWIINQLESIPNVNLFIKDFKDETIYDLDITKILFGIEGIRGNSLQEILYKDYNIRMEMSDYYNVLAVTTVMNTKNDFEKLLNAVREIAINYKRENILDISLDMPRPIIKMKPSLAYFGKKKSIKLEESLGYTSAVSVIPYPPGVPLLAPGELITKEILDYLKFLIDNNFNIVNLTDNMNKIAVVEEDE
ncbi:MAG: aminotransferase class I/II-fold pyridoxal phosphate-dependent enzyme [Tissierellia bacterium]|nr:aminotransferase class I/II-fold pyridoxal phosphate-dependent enzyme [Tissierellia bacterium]